MIGEGHGAVRLVDVSGNTIQLDTSGRITIAGGSITASISGDTVIAKISGETVISNVSGNIITAKVSGEQIRFTQASGFNGVNITDQSGATAVFVGNWAGVDGNANSLKGLFTSAALQALDETGATINRLRVTASGSAGSSGGTRFKLLVSCSGDPVSTSGNAVNMAGAVVTAPTWVTITGASGGTTLSAQACTMVRLMNLSGNGTMLVGGTGTAGPVSGTKGIMLWPGSLSVQGTEMDFPVNNANLLAVVAHTSGNTLAYMTFG